MIVLDSGERGEVTHIGIRSTRILTRDDVEITLPNSIMGNVKITGAAAGGYPRTIPHSDQGGCGLRVGYRQGPSHAYGCRQQSSGFCKAPNWWRFTLTYIEDAAR